MSELKPCPNPECTNPRWTEYLPNDGWVECECGVTGPSPSEEKIGRRGDVRKEAVRLWNLLPSTNWVSVDERLPMVNELYFVRFGGDTYGCTTYIFSEAGFHEDGVTHWLDNLPPIPTGAPNGERR